MGELIKAAQRGRRLKGLEEFQAPSFVGRMARVQQQRKLLWYVTVGAVVAIGLSIGLLI